MEALGHAWHFRVGDRPELGTLALGAPGTSEAPAPGAEAAFVRQLGDADLPRASAAQELLQSGDAALPALQAALTDPDAEISARPGDLHDHHGAFAGARGRAARHGRQGRRGRGLRGGGENANAAGVPTAPTFEDCLAVGNDWQLADAWDKAVKGYQPAVERVDDVLGGDPEDGPAAAPGAQRAGQGCQYERGRPSQHSDWPGGSDGSAPTGAFGATVGTAATDRAAAARQTGRSGGGGGDVRRVQEDVPEFQGDLVKLLPQLAAEYPALRDEARKKSEVNWDKIGLYLHLVYALEVHGGSGQHAGGTGEIR